MKRRLADLGVPLVVHHHHSAGDRLPPSGYREADRVIARCAALSEPA